MNIVITSLLIVIATMLGILIGEVQDLARTKEKEPRPSNVVFNPRETKSILYQVFVRSGGIDNPFSTTLYRERKAAVEYARYAARKDKENYHGCVVADTEDGAMLRTIGLTKHFYAKEVRI